MSHNVWWLVSSSAGWIAKLSGLDLASRAMFDTLALLKREENDLAPSKHFLLNIIALVLPGVNASQLILIQDPICRHCYILMMTKGFEPIVFLHLSKEFHTDIEEEGRYDSLLLNYIGGL